jgi:hypothetical protein
VECGATPTTLPVCVTTTSTTTTTTVPDQSQSLGPAGCDVAPSGVTSTVSTADELRQKLLGQWYDCKTPGTFAPDSDGIEFTADDHYYFLRLNDGALNRQTGFGQAGTYEIIDTSAYNGPGHFQLNLNLNSGGYMIIQWSFAERPRLFRVDNEGVTSTLYSHMPVASSTGVR